MFETIDSAIVGLLTGWETAYPGVPLVFGNAPFDLNDPPERFAEVEVDHEGGNPIGARAAPKTRYRGHVRVCIHTREGLGRATSNAMLTWFADALKYQNSGPVRLQEPKPDGNDTMKGWHHLDLKVPFYADET